MSQSGLPNLDLLDNTQSKLFNRQLQTEIAYKADEVDAVIGYFLKRNFEKVAAINTAAILLEQASKDKIPAFQLIDTLKGLNDVQLSNVVAQILNLNRNKTSKIGYRISPQNELFDQRNILGANLRIPEIIEDLTDYMVVGYVDEGYVE